jgi:Zn-dependent protease
MFGRSIELFKLFGFAVRVDFSWLIIAVLVTWTLATGVFPTFSEGLSELTYWLMGIFGALGLFGSIVLHELAHSLVARAHGVMMRGITLFIFGGVAEMDEEPPSAKAEFWVAVAGPAASVVVAAVSYGIAETGERVGWPVAVTGVLMYLAVINLVLVGFNLIPAFPLDGGRVFRSLLWWLKGNLKWATKVSATLGSAFGVVLIVLGMLSILNRNLVGGIWGILLGLFVRGAAQASYRQLLVRGILEGEPIGRFMQRRVLLVPPSITIRQLVDEHFYQHHFKMFPVVEGDRLVGCIRTAQIKDLPRDQWDQRTVAEVAEPCSEENTVHPATDAVKVLTAMSRYGVSRMMVVDDGGQLVGIVSLKDLMRFISLRLELEEE